MGTATKRSVAKKHFVQKQTLQQSRELQDSIQRKGKGKLKTDKYRLLDWGLGFKFYAFH